MPKLTDVPPELRQLNKLFSKKDYSWDYADSFRDWVDFLVESFMPVREGAYERLAKKHGDLEWFGDMTRELIMVQNRMIGDRDDGWYDTLGTFYEVLSSRGKRQTMGQFFTPETVCDFMTAITLTEDITGKGLSVCDPASGSGRMLISFHAQAPGNYQYGADLDAICAKMTAVNMVLHGCVGQAVCMNSLLPDDWRFGYQINRRLNRTGVPTIEPMPKEECRAWQMWQQQKAQWEEARKTEPDLPKPVPIAVQQPRPKKQYEGQFSLF